MHHHYLKGSLFCGRCHKAGITQRLIIQHTVNSRGTPYTYFFCRGKQTGTCSAPHVHVLRVEAAVEAHYATVQFSPEFIGNARKHLATALEDHEAGTRLRRRQLTAELQALDAKESNLIDLVADGTIPQAKVEQKLRDIERQRRHVTERLAAPDTDVTDTAQLIELCLKLLENPQELYLRCDDEQRRMLNQAIFHRLYVDYDAVSARELREPFAQLHALPGSALSEPPHRGERRREGASDGTGAPPAEAPTSDGIGDLLVGIDSVHCSSKRSRGDLTWHNPNSSLLVEGPEITVRPVRNRSLPPRARGPPTLTASADARDASRHQSSSLIGHHREPTVSRRSHCPPSRPPASRSARP